MLLKRLTEDDATERLTDEPEVIASSFAAWRQQAPDLLARHLAEYSALLAKIAPLVAAGRLAEAAAAAQVAANHAALWHNGSFVCQELEEAIAEIGKAALPHPGRPVQPKIGRPLNVLHVATEVYAIGGHSRMAEQWMREDSGNRHSLALTRQHEPLPPSITAAVQDSGGRVTELNRGRSTLLDWARGLQAEMAKADVVVMHVHSMDVIPFLACAGMRRRPPVLFVNHTDHLFWVGARFIDLVLCSRLSGHQLCLDRRGIPEARLGLLPLCLDDVRWQGDREQARAKLGLAADDVMILTVARAAKFTPVGDEEFPDPFIELLRRNPRARLVAVGPGGGVDWSKAEAVLPGRVRAIAATPDTGPYFAAADIYLDSFPFVSITSLLEAARAGLPMVTRSPFGDDCAVMGADTIGFDASSARTASVAEATAVLQRLIDDRALRRRLGDAARAETERLNMGAGWRQALEATYARARFLPTDAPMRATSLGAVTDLDRFIPFVYGDQRRGGSAGSRLVAAVEAAIKAGPLAWRVRTILELRRLGIRMGKGQVVRWIIPEWLTSRLRDLQRRRSKA